jgi:hypothetical protein
MKQIGTLLLLALLYLPSQLRAAQSPFDIDVKELDQKNPPPAPKAEKKTTKKAKRTAPGAVGDHNAKVHKETASETGYIRYTVKPGDHIFKILVGRLGMSNEAAERLIPEIIRINNISNIKTLTVGRTLLIPGDRQEHAAKSLQHKKARHKKGEGLEAAPASSEAGKLETQGAVSARTEVPGVQTPPAEPQKVPSAPVVSVPTAPTPVLPEETAPSAAKPAAKLPAAQAPIVAAPSVLPSAAPAVPKAALAAAPSAEVPATTATPPNFSAPPAAPAANTWICSVTEKDPARIVDAIMNAVSLRWSKNRIIQSDEGAQNAFSIRVDRYFELKGVRYILSIGESDPYTYTLIRLLEGAGYRTLMINSNDDFKAVGDKLLRFVGLNPDFGMHVIQGGKQSTGFLLQPDDAEGRRVVITSEAANPKLRWALPAGCGAR